MPAPQKRVLNTQLDLFPLSDLIQSLNVSPFQLMLPHGTCPVKTLYYTPESLLKALLLRNLLNLTYRDLELFLVTHKSYAQACGLPTDFVPDASYFCKFFTQLMPEILEQLAVSSLQQLCQYLDLSCQVVALDSSVFYAWANSFQKRADPDARTGKSSTKGWFFGYKLHLVVDVATELPIAIILTPGNRYDGHELKPLLQKTQLHLSAKIRAVLTDKGYDAGYNYLTIIEDLEALPIIPKRGQESSHLTRQQTLDSYLLLPPPKSLPKEITDRHTREKTYRDSPPLARTDPQWKQLSTARLAVERVISRFKAFFCPERLRVTGLIRGVKWGLFGWLGMLASALFLCQLGRVDLIRSFPYIR